jgi:hypothetical protein
MESRADTAVAEDLLAMVQDILALRTHLVLQDRARADSLLLRLDSLLNAIPAVSRLQARVAEPIALKLCLNCARDRAAITYRVQLFELGSGATTEDTIRPSFDAAVALVRHRLPIAGDYYIAATWSRDSGKMAVTTPKGQVLARIDPIAPDDEHDRCGCEGHQPMPPVVRELPARYGAACRH